MPKIAKGGMEGWRKVPKVVPFGGLRGLVPGAQTSPGQFLVNFDS